MIKAKDIQRIIAANETAQEASIEIKEMVDNYVEQQLKNCNLQNVTQQSELLMACLNKLNELGYNLDFEYDEETCNEVVKAINCG